MNLPKHVTIVEVGPRDGLQNEKERIPTETKVQFIDALSESGLSIIEVTSFVHPKWVPQLADASEVLAKITRKKGVRYPVLVPNLKGLARAIESEVKDIAVFTATSETFNKKNINRTVDESLHDIAAIVKGAQEHDMCVRGYLSTCFGCPYGEKISPRKVLELTEKLLTLNIFEVSLGDTIGVATPEQVKETLSLLLEAIPADKLAVHFHDTQGRALENIRVALELGIATIDSSAGGLGGCPYAPGASGNVATEAVVAMLDEMGIETGVDLEKLLQASTTLA
jgi:hydroxymethylglutaryl-CoA lyase